MQGDISATVPTTSRLVVADEQWTETPQTPEEWNKLLSALKEVKLVPDETTVEELQDPNYKVWQLDSVTSLSDAVAHLNKVRDDLSLSSDDGSDLEIITTDKGTEIAQTYTDIDKAKEALDKDPDLELNGVTEEGNEETLYLTKKADSALSSALPLLSSQGFVSFAIPDGSTAVKYSKALKVVADSKCSFPTATAIEGDSVILYLSDSASVAPAITNALNKVLDSKAVSKCDLIRILSTYVNKRYN